MWKDGTGWIVNGKLLPQTGLSGKVQSWERRPRQKVRLSLRKVEQRRLRSQEQTLGQEERKAGYKDFRHLLWLEEWVGKYCKFGSYNFAEKERRKKKVKER